MRERAKQRRGCLIIEIRVCFSPKEKNTMDANETKEAILHFIENVDDEGSEKLWKFISENFKVVVSDYDRKAIERGEREIKEGRFRMV